MLKTPELKNSKRQTLIRREAFMLVWVMSPSLAVMKTRKIEIMPLKMVRESDDITLKRLVRKSESRLFFWTSSTYWMKPLRTKMATEQTYTITLVRIMYLRGLSAFYHRMSSG